MYMYMMLNKWLIMSLFQDPVMMFRKATIMPAALIKLTSFSLQWVLFHLSPSLTQFLPCVLRSTNASSIDNRT